MYVGPGPIISRFGNFSQLCAAIEHHTVGLEGSNSGAARAGSWRHVQVRRELSLPLTCRCQWLMIDTVTERVCAKGVRIPLAPALAWGPWGPLGTPTSPGLQLHYRNPPAEVFFLWPIATAFQFASHPLLVPCPQFCEIEFCLGTNNSGYLGTHSEPTFSLTTATVYSKPFTIAPGYSVLVRNVFGTSGSDTLALKPKLLHTMPRTF